MAPPVVIHSIGLPCVHSVAVSGEGIVDSFSLALSLSLSGLFAMAAGIPLDGSAMGARCGGAWWSLVKANHLYCGWKKCCQYMKLKCLALLTASFDAPSPVPPMFNVEA